MYVYALRALCSRVSRVLKVLRCTINGNEKCNVANMRELPSWFQNGDLPRVGGGVGERARGSGKGQARRTENRESKTKGGAGKTTPSGSMLDRWRSPDLTMHWVRTQDSKLRTPDCGLRTEDSAADRGPRRGPRHHREMKTTQAKIQSYFYCRLVGCISRRAQGSGHIAEWRKRVWVGISRTSGKKRAGHSFHTGKKMAISGH